MYQINLVGQAVSVDHDTLIALTEIGMNYDEMERRANSICEAYTFIEYNKSFEEYRKDDKDNLSIGACLDNWLKCKKAYSYYSKIMTDRQLTSLQKEIIYNM